MSDHGGSAPQSPKPEADMYAPQSPTDEMDAPLSPDPEVQRPPRSPELEEPLQNAEAEVVDESPYVPEEENLPGPEDAPASPDREQNKDNYPENPQTQGDSIDNDNADEDNVSPVKRKVAVNSDSENDEAPPLKKRAVVDSNDEKEPVSGDEDRKPTSTPKKRRVMVDSDDEEPESPKGSGDEKERNSSHRSGSESGDDEGKIDEGESGDDDDEEEKKKIDSCRKMVQLIRIKMHDKELSIVSSQNVLARSSIRSAFLLADEAIVSLSYKITGVKVHCEMNKNGSAFILPEDFSNMQFSVESDKAPSRPSTPADVEGSTSKRQRIDPEMEPLPVDGDVISRIGQYAWFYTKGDNLKRSAIPVTKNLAITYAHGENKNFVKGDSITLSSYQNQKVVVDTCVVLVNSALDLILLQSKSAELCDKDLIMEAVEPKRGMNYILMGYSIIHGKTSHISFSAGIISSDITSRMRFLGSSGSFKGDSGGSCWSDDGRLIGMQVETLKVPHTTDNSGRPASPASGGRCGIIPITKIHAIIVKFLPPEEDVDWNE